MEVVAGISAVLQSGDVLARGGSKALPWLFGKSPIHQYTKWMARVQPVIQQLHANADIVDYGILIDFLLAHKEFIIAAQNLTCMLERREIGWFSLSTRKFVNDYSKMARALVNGGMSVSSSALNKATVCKLRHGHPPDSGRCLLCFRPPSPEQREKLSRLLADLMTENDFQEDEGGSMVTSEIADSAMQAPASLHPSAESVQANIESMGYAIETVDQIEDKLKEYLARHGGLEFNPWQTRYSTMSETTFVER